MVLLAVFVVWMCVTSISPLNPGPAWEAWEKVMKIMFMTFVAAFVLRGRRQVQALIWTLVLSLGFYTAKGGLFTILGGGGAGRVQGPEGTSIGDNNAFGLAAVMLIPLIVHLYRTSQTAVLKAGLAGLAVLTVLSALGTYSRGALLAIGTMGLLLWLRSNRKIIAGVTITAIAGVAIPFMPDQWEARMRSISEYSEDGSALGRFNSWYTAWNIASDRWLGGGFEYYSPLTSLTYSPNPLEVRASHSIYFQVIGEHGFIGFALFMMLGLLLWSAAAKIRRVTRDWPEQEWAHSLASMIQVTLAGFVVGGAFLNVAYYDFLYYLLVAIVVTRHEVLGAARRPPQGQWPDGTDASRSHPASGQRRPARTGFASYT